MKISVSSYSFAQYIREGKMTQLECVEKAVQMGFDAIEFTDIDGAGDLGLQKENAQKIKKAATDAGITVNAYTVGACLYNDSEEKMELEVKRLCGQLDVAKILGAPIMRHDVCYSLAKAGNGRSFDLMLPFIAENARRVTGYAGSLGIKTCVENHGYIAQDSDRVERLFNAVAHDNFGLLVDIGNFICVDEEPASAVSRLAPYAIHAHAKDMLVRPEPIGNCKCMTRGGNYFCGTAIGEGDIPVKRCLKILKAAGYDGFLSVEYEGTEDCISGIGKGLSCLKKILEEI